MDYTSEIIITDIIVRAFVLHTINKYVVLKI
jgi:hypothetical protein